MCGFITWLGENPDLKSLEKGSRLLKHRGPDDHGSWSDPSKNIFFKHRRLSIIDIEHGQQPYCYRGNSIIYNGETYNYRDLRAQLKTAGFKFETDSDTEVILKGYLHWGTDIFDRIRGMFSIAIWDQEKNHLLLGRDPLGQKPLFYYRDSKNFIAGSEIQALLQQPPVSRLLNPGAFADFFNLGYIPAPQSAIQNIKKLPPGHYMVVKNTGQPQITRYWNPVDFYSKPGIENPLERIRENVTESIRRRLISDVPVGAFLSGGIDSSIIVSLMQQLTEQQVTTVCVGFSEKKYDERKFARQIAEKYNTDHHEYRVKIQLSELLPRLVRHFGEPFADSSAVPTFYVASQARKAVKVVLSGDGGDELFGGYRRYRAMRILNNAQRFTPDFLRRFIAAGFNKLGIPAQRRSATGEIIRLLQNFAETPSRQYASMVGIDDQNLTNKLLNNDLIAAGGENQNLLEQLLDTIPGRANTAGKFMLLDLLSYLPGDLLVKTDITSMMNSLECRCPFLDRDLVELALSIPDKEKIKGKWGKVCLRSSFSDLLPDEINKRPKTGFGVPLARWFRQGKHSDYLCELLLEKNTDFFTLVNRQELEKELRLHRRGKIDIAPLLWAVAVFKLWFTELQIKI